MARDPLKGFVNDGWPAEIQDLVDQLLAATEGGGDCIDHAAFEELTIWLEGRMGAEGIVSGEAGDLLHAVDLTVTSPFDDDGARDWLELDEDATVTDGQRLRYMREYLRNRLKDPSKLDADYHPTCFLVDLCARTGEHAILAGGVKGYSFTMVQYEWYGLYKDRQDFERRMLDAGLVTSAEAFARLPAAARLRFWRG